LAATEGFRAPWGISVSHPFASKYDSGGFIVEVDPRHWFKFEFERDYTGAHRVVSVVTSDYSDDANAMSIDSDSAYLQVARLGDAFYLYESSDGKGWYLVRVFHFEHAGALKVGLIAQCPEGKSVTINFSDVRYRAGRVHDIWKGE
jgi:regulation of enolase protein 1 (concanavalin A-like superfamily)